MHYISDDSIVLARGSVDGDDVPVGYVRSFQEDLVALGFDVGKIDGDFGRNTHDACVAFQNAAMTGIRWLDGRVCEVEVSYGGTATGRVDKATREEILRWQALGYARTFAVPAPWTAPAPPRAFRETPFAEPTGKFWPVHTRDGHGRKVAMHASDGTVIEAGRSFGASRDAGRRFHVGIDVFGQRGDPIFACEAGTLVNFYPFYRGTYALFVQNDSGLVINYGEVERESLTRLGLKIGAHVAAGTQIAYVGQMRESAMLHFEMYAHGTHQNKRWMNGEQRPAGLLDPTQYLLRLAAEGG